MANVSMGRFYERPRLPYTVSSEAVKLYTPLRRAKTEYSSQRALKRDVSETLQQAALINIVAAVNEDIHGYPVAKSDITEPGSAIDSLKNTVAVISNLMTPRHRSVSIPKQQHKVFNMSDDIVQKKPMYFRQTEDDGRLHKVSEKTVEAVKGNKSSVSEEVTCPSPVQSVKIMPVKTKYNDSDMKVIEANLRKSADKPAKPSDSSRDSKLSSVRRLGTLKSKPRKVHEVSKCDAVDLMDTNNSLFDTKQVNQDPAKAILDDSRKMIPHSHLDPYVRPKSLPGAFPSKAKKFNRAKSSPPGKQHVYKNKNPIANSIRDTPQSMYSRMMTLPGGFGFESLAIGNGVNQEPDVFSPLSHDSTRAQNHRVSFTGLATQRHGRRLGTPRTYRTYSTESTWSALSTFHDHDSEERPETVSRLHEAIESAMGRSSKAEEEEWENKENEGSVYTMPKHDIVRHDTVDLSSKTARKVQFDSKEVTQISTSSDESFVNDPSRSNVNGGSSIIQMPMSVFRSYSPAIQPMSANELLRFKQRIFPANMHQRNRANMSSYFSTSSIMNIKQIYSKPAVIPAKLELVSIDSDADDGDEEPDATQNFMTKADKENEVVDNVQDNNRFSEDKCRPEANEEGGKGSLESNENDQDKPDFYKLVKAIDTHAYSGFEHKKLRRGSDLGSGKGEGKQKGHYVKVKLK